jgi:glycosyltransferase involved in cell wall biosynthesis
MNILQVVPKLDAGGVERTTIEIVEALSLAGHRAHVASEGGRLEDELSAAGGELHVLKLASKNPLSLRSNTRALIKLIKEHKIDLVHARSRAPAWAAKAAADAARIPFITTYHGIYNSGSRLKRRYNAVMVKGEIVIANSNFTKDHIVAEHGTDPDRIVVIPRGVDMRAFDPAKIKQAGITELRAEWGVSGNRPLILLPGRLTRWKGQLVAVDAMAELKNNGVEAQLILLGDAQGRDDYVAEIELKIETLGLENDIVIAPHTNNMSLAYAAADIVVSASTDPEAFGRVAAEAQAMQKLVVATNHGGATETVIDGETGFLVKPGDPKALANGIASILAISGKQRREMGKKARLRIGQDFSAKSLKKTTLEVYDKVLNGHRGK